MIMKLILEFNLPEEQSEAELAQKVMQYYSVCYEFSNKLHSLNKHNETIPDEHLDVIKNLWDECGGYDLDMSY